MWPLIKKYVLNSNFSIWSVVLFTIVFSHSRHLSVEAASNKLASKTYPTKCQFEHEIINGTCKEPPVLQDEPLKGCETSGCSHSCIISAGKAFCHCPDGLELGQDWKTCQESGEEEDTDDADDNNEEEEEGNNDGNENEEDADYEDEYEDEVNNSDAKKEELEVNKDTDKDIRGENERLLELDKIDNEDSDGRKDELDNKMREKVNEEHTEDKILDELTTETAKVEENNSDIHEEKTELEEIGRNEEDPEVGVGENFETTENPREVDISVIKEYHEHKKDALNNDRDDRDENEEQENIHEENIEFKENERNEEGREVGVGENFEAIKDPQETDISVKEYNEHNYKDASNIDTEDEDEEENEDDYSENYDETEEEHTENYIDKKDDQTEIDQSSFTTEKPAEEIKIAKEDSGNSVNGEINEIVEKGRLETTSITAEIEENITVSNSSEDDNSVMEIPKEKYIEEDYGEEYDENYEDFDKTDDETKNNEVADDLITMVGNQTHDLVNKTPDNQHIIEDEVKQTEGNVSKLGSTSEDVAPVIKEDTRKEITNNNVFTSNEDIEKSTNSSIEDNVGNITNNNLFSIYEDMEESTTTSTTVADNVRTEDENNVPTTQENVEDDEEYEDEYEDEENDEDNEIIPSEEIVIVTTFKPILTTLKTCEIGFETANGESKCVDINECQNKDLNPCEHDCVNTKGHFYCTCDPGYELSSDDNSSCLDIDECLRNLCSNGCTNSPGSYQCTCPHNFYLTNDKCIEIKCTHGYDFNKSQNYLKCVCPQDYFLASDNSTCIHNNDCEQNHGCSQLCRNKQECFCYDGFILLQDSHTCQDATKFCQTGFTYNWESKSCEDIDECSDVDCVQVCVNTIGSFECDCNIGFQLEDDEITCRDIDECSEEGQECEHDCFNTIGSYNCGCRNGFELAENQRNCRDIDECDTDNGNCSHQCENLMGNYRCACTENFSLTSDKRTCQEVDLCLANNGGCSHSCLSVQGKVLCSCPKTHELAESKTCRKINPCERNNGGCSHVCELNNDFVYCKCPESYKLHNDTHCDKINPCFEFNNGCSHICETVDDTAICKCPDDTYELVDKICHKINLCLIDNGGCSHSCVFVDNRIRCSCPKEFELLADLKTCHDHHQEVINPCSENNGDCSHECIFKDGVKTCLCPRGLQLLDHSQLTCQWIDACLSNSNNGGCSHVCESVTGQAICKCPQRFELVNKTCVRINPCLINNGGCSHLCHSTFRRRVKCSCPTTEINNYVLHGKICLKHDVCQKDNGGCSHICTQKYGRRVCSCPEGFILRSDGFSCKEVNECRIGNGGCSHGCINTVGSYNCTCPKGLQLAEDSTSICQDIDECQEKDSCDQTCTNYHGGFKCSCRSGFILDKDGRKCKGTGFSECANFQMMEGPGNVRCLGMNVEGRKYVPVGTRCIVWCDKGYKLHGEAIHMCQNTGNWSSEMPSCIRTACPKIINNPKAGRLIPSSCTSSKTFAGEKCRIYCKRGYRNVPGLEYIECQANLQWTTIGRTKILVGLEEIQTACVQAEAPKPFILCPEQGRLTFDLPVGQNKMEVTIPRPRSNIDWWRYIHAEPSWAKSLTATLHSGRTDVKFTAYSPVTNDSSASCHLVIYVRDNEPPTLIGCPGNDIHVQLQRGERQRNVYWSEPQVTDNVAVTTLYQSKDSGSQFSVGKHYVNYVASDGEGNRAYCHFNVIVKGSPEEMQVVSGNKLYRAVLVCPDGIHVAESKGDPNERNNIQVEAGCHWKHVRVTSPHLTGAVRPAASSYFQRQYPDPYQNYPFSSNRFVQSYRDNQQQSSYKPFSWYHRCC